jgi:hypothetical protein
LFNSEGIGHRSGVDIDQLREFRKGVRKARSLKPEKRQGVLRKTLIEMG